MTSFFEHTFFTSPSQKFRFFQYITNSMTLFYLVLCGLFFKGFCLNLFSRKDAALILLKAADKSLRSMIEICTKATFAITAGTFSVRADVFPIPKPTKPRVLEVWIFVVN